jgi:AcrR family transcriptional regulator
MATRPRTRKPLSKDRVLAKAIALADADGIEALTMRKLGHALGVEAMSLYNHVANKGELVSAMVDSVIDQFELPEDGAWDAAVRRCAISGHDLLIEHAWACRLALLPSDVTTIAGPRIRYMEWLLRRLREAGFSAEVAYSAYHTLDSHIFGFTLWQLGHGEAARAMTPPPGEQLEEWAQRLLEQMRDTYPYLAEHGEQHMADDAPSGRYEFEFGLDLILEGLKKWRRKR